MSCILCENKTGFWQMTIDGIVAYDFEDECQRKYDSDWGTVTTLPKNMVLIRQP